MRALPPAQQEELIAARREAANARLLRLKSALLRETPELSALRLLAFSSAFRGDAALLSVAADGAGFRWVLNLGGQPLLRSPAPEISAVMAAVSAERAFAFAGRATNYSGFDAGGGVFRLRLTDGGGLAPQILAESVQGFPSLGDANAAAPSLAAQFALVRIESSLSPLERRVAHHAGIRGARRRPALRPIGDFFEIFDEPAPPGFFGRRWRLRAAMPAGATRLGSVVRYDQGWFQDHFYLLIEFHRCVSLSIAHNIKKHLI